MRKNRLGVIMIVATLVLTLLLPGCDNGKDPINENQDSGSVSAAGDEITFPLKEKVTLKIIAPKQDSTTSFDQKKFFTDLEEKTNVHIVWDNVSVNAWTQMKTLTFATNQIPDAFAGMKTFAPLDIVIYSAQGYFQPLENLIDKYAPNYKKILQDFPDFQKKMTLPDGHVYSLLVYEEDKVVTPDKLAINMDWLNALNLKVPQTTQEFYDVLKAFKTGDPNKNGKPDEIPFVFRANTAGQGLNSYYGAFGIVDSADHTVVKGEKVVYTAVQPEYKEGIKFMHQLISEGLADKESLTQDASMYNAKVKIKDPAKQIAGSFIVNGLAQSFGTTDHNCVYVPPLKGPQGQQLWKIAGNDLASMGAFCITNVNKHPEVTMAWVDQFYDERNSFQMRNGLIGRTIKENADGTLEYLPTPEGKSTVDWRTEDVFSQFLFCIRKSTADKLVVDGIDQDFKDADKIYSPYKGDFTPYPSLYMTSEEAEEVATLSADLKAYVNQAIANWMLNGNIDAEWDGFIKKCNDMKLQRYLELRQQIYDRYK